MREVNVLNVWDTGFDDVRCDVSLSINNIHVASVVSSYEKAKICNVIGIKNSELENINANNVKNALAVLVLSDFEKYLNLPTLSNCSPLLQELYDEVHESENSSCYITKDYWNDSFSDKYKKADFDNLVNELAKYGLSNDGFINFEDNEMILGFNSIELCFNDDRSFVNNYDYQVYIENKIADNILKEFRSSKVKNKEILSNICNENNMGIDDYLFVEGYDNYKDFYNELIDVKDDSFELN